MNERAAAAPKAARSVWHVDEGWSFFAGPLHHNERHRHSTSVFLAGLYGAFKLRLNGADWLSCRTAVIPAGVEYEFDIAGDPLGVFYLEPSVGRADALVPLVGSAREVDGALIGASGAVLPMRTLFECRSSPVGPALDSLIDFSTRRSRRPIDVRIARVARLLGASRGDAVPVAQAAASAGLSVSRFQHLFTREVGVPFRRYRGWHRLRRAIREVIGGSNLTTAAHAAGFADQAHFSRDFRRTFGAPPSRGL